MKVRKCLDSQFKILYVVSHLSLCKSHASLFIISCCSLVFSLISCQYRYSSTRVFLNSYSSFFICLLSKTGVEFNWNNMSRKKTDRQTGILLESESNFKFPNTQEDESRREVCLGNDFLRPVSLDCSRLFTCVSVSSSFSWSMKTQTHMTGYSSQWWSNDEFIAFHQIFRERQWSSLWKRFHHQLLKLPFVEGMKRRIFQNHLTSHWTTFVLPSLSFSAQKWIKHQMYAVEQRERTTSIHDSLPEINVIKSAAKGK